MTLGRDPKGTIVAKDGSKVKINAPLGFQTESAKAANGGMVHPSLGMYKVNLDALALVDYYLMKDYYQIRSAFAIMSFTLQSVHWWIEGPDKDINEAVTWQIKRIWSDLMRVITKAYWAGFSPAVKMFDIDEEKGYLYIKQLRDLSPFMCTVVLDPTDQSFDGFVQKKGSVVVTNKDGTTKTVQKPVQYIEPQYAFWYAYMMEEGNYSGQKLLKGAYLPWFFSQIIHLYANRYYYRFSTPTIVGEAPGDIVEDKNGNQVDAQEVMFEIVKGIRNGASVALPSDKDENGNPKWSLKILESLARGYDFETYLKRLDKEMARAMFLPDLVYDTGRVGSYKLGESQKDTYMMLLNANTNDIKLFIDRYIIEQFVKNNFAKKVQMPQFKYEEQGTLFSSLVGEVISKLIQGKNVDFDIEELSQKTGFPMKKAKPVAVATSAAPKDATKDPKVEARKSFTALASAQVGRIMASVENGSINPETFQLGFRAKLDKLWHKHIMEEDTSGVYGQILYASRDILLSKDLTNSQKREALFKKISEYYEQAIG